MRSVPSAAVGPRDLGAAGVAHGHPHLVLLAALDDGPVGDDAGRAVDLGRADRDVADVRARRRVQPHRPVQSRVVEEVVEVLLHAAAVVELLHVARRDRRPRQLVVDHDRHARLLARAHVLGDVGLERRVAALVLDDLRVADPRRRAVRGGVEAQDDPLPVPAPRHADRALVPDVADVVARLARRHDVVEAGRDGHLRVARQRASSTSARPGRRRRGRARSATGRRARCVPAWRTRAD